MTGGAPNANCLTTMQAGGMGEGWSDFIAIAMTAKETDTAATDRVVGAYVTNSAKGVRMFPYSTSMTTNPQTYNTLSQPNTKEVHRIGEVWNTMLFELYWNMVTLSGLTPVTAPNLITAAASGTGNTNALRLVVDGIRMQPCNPTFVQARDAILKANDATFKGAYLCEIWKAFAKRGLGFTAVDDGNFVNAFDMPPNAVAQCATRVAGKTVLVPPPAVV
ncbi:Fungalysin/Thermolysin Extracellular metalloproteinase 5, partial [Irineochytrium annulatum]